MCSRSFKRFGGVEVINQNLEVTLQQGRIVKSFPFLNMIPERDTELDWEIPSTISIHITKIG